MCRLHSTINRLHHRFLSKYVVNTSCPKKSILSKVSMLYQSLKLQPCSAQFTKSRAHIRCSKNVENSDMFTGKLSWWSLLFKRLQVLSLSLYFYYTSDSATEVFLYVLCKLGLFKNSEQDIFAILFLTKLQAFNL